MALENFSPPGADWSAQGKDRSLQALESDFRNRACLLRAGSRNQAPSRSNHAALCWLMGTQGSIKLAQPQLKVA
jgi:hypothetical protein